MFQLSISHYFEKRYILNEKDKKTISKNYLAMLLLWSRRSNDRVIQDQSHRSAVDRVSWRRFASRVIHVFADSISRNFHSFRLDREISFMCNTDNPRIRFDEIHCRAVMYCEIEGYYCLIRSIKLHYGTTTTNAILSFHEISRGSHWNEKDIDFTM